MSKELYEAAKKYLDFRFSVIPVKVYWSEEEKKFIKKPAPWKEYQKRRATEEGIRKWFLDSDQYNGIGIVTGWVSGVYVVDVDGELSEEDKKKFRLYTGRIAKTISGGTHLYFTTGRGTPVLQNAVRVGGLPIDLRAEGGFVVAPPTFAIKDGKKHEYRWIKGKDLESMFLGVLSQDFLKLLNQKKNTLSGGGNWQEAGTPRLNLREHLQVGKGERNNRLYRLACSLLGKHDADEAWELILASNQTYSPPLPVNEVRALFRSAVSFIEKEKNIIEKVQGEEGILVGKPISWAEIQTEKLEKRWIWENYIARGNITLLTAIMKAGKSTFLRCLLLALAQEKEFAGQPTKKTNVLVISEESDDKWVEAREELEGEYGHVYIWVRPVRGKPSHKKWEEIVKKITVQCLELDIGLVVIDTLSSFWPIDDENSSAQVVRALVPLYNFTENDIGVLLVHHDRKGGGKYGEASRGSSALTAFVDNIIHFTRTSEGLPNQRILRSWGRFSGVVPNVLVEYTNEGEYKLKGNPYQVSHSAKLEKLLDLIQEQPKPVTIRELFNLWNATIGEINIRSIHRLKDELLENGQIKIAKEEIHGRRKTPYFSSTGWKEKQMT